jgi:hypothetical protein
MVRYLRGYLPVAEVEPLPELPVVLVDGEPAFPDVLLLELLVAGLSKLLPRCDGSRIIWLSVQ